MFLKRDKELTLLDAFYASANSTAAIVYGIRQIGKSSLLMKSVKDRENVLYYECLDAPVEENLVQLAKKASMQLRIPVLAAEDIISFFDSLRSFNRNFIIILDEYQYLKRNISKGNMDSYLQVIIDSIKNTGIKIVLCGSYVTDMKELLDEDNPLFNRFQLILHLQELDYLDSSAFYPGISSYEKAAFYSVFGGHPNALSMLDENLSLEENIKRLFLQDNAPLRFYLEFSLFKELRKAQGANAVMDILKNSKLRFSEINQRIKGIEEKNLLRQLNVLIDIEAVEKESPINDQGDRKKTFYMISNNLVRFYYTYIFSYKEELSILGPDTFYRMYIQPSINTFISYRVEGIARSYFSRLAKNNTLGDVYNIGTYWYDDKKRKRNGEFDCVLKRKDSFDIYEVKYLAKPLSLALMTEEIKKIRDIEDLKIRKIGFISFSGFEEKMKDVDQISGDDIYL